MPKAKILIETRRDSPCRYYDVTTKTQLGLACIAILRQDLNDGLHDPGPEPVKPHAVEEYSPCMATSEKTRRSLQWAEYYRKACVYEQALDRFNQAVAFVDDRNNAYMDIADQVFEFMQTLPSGAGLSMLDLHDPYAIELKRLRAAVSGTCCHVCGGTWIGDGHTTVRHCENAEFEDYQYVEPDAQPIPCRIF